MKKKYILRFDVYLFKYYYQHAHALYFYIPIIFLHLGHNYLLSLQAVELKGIKHPIIFNIKNKRNAQSNV